MPSFQQITAIATGGAISLTYTTTATGSVSLSRAVSGSTSYTPLYSGVSNTTTGVGQFFLDFGDNGILDPSLFYVYRLIDPVGTALSYPVQPAGQLKIEAQPTTQIFMKLMQSGLNNLYTPPGIAKPTVTFQMPQGGLPPMPFITIFPTMIKQAQQKIGVDFESPDDEGVWTINELATSMIQVSILTKTAQELDFYTNAVIGIFKTIYIQVLSEIGQDVEHSYIASANQPVVGDFNNMSPGFFLQDVLCRFTGINNISIIPSYGLIEHIDATAYDPEGNLLIEVVIPPE